MSVKKRSLFFYSKDFDGFTGTGNVAMNLFVRILTPTVRHDSVHLAARCSKAKRTSIDFLLIYRQITQNK